MGELLRSAYAKRLNQDRDAEADHTWMWRLNPHHGGVMESEEYVDSIRLRLGCAGPCEPVPDWIPGQWRGPRDLLRVGRGHARAQRAVLRLHCRD